MWLHLLFKNRSRRALKVIIKCCKTWRSVDLKNNEGRSENLKCMTITAKSSDSAPVFDWLEEIENDSNAKMKNDK